MCQCGGGVCVQVCVFMQVWTFVTRVQRLLMNGYTSQIWLDDTFHYCYFLLLYNPSEVSEAQGWGDLLYVLCAHVTKQPMNGRCDSSFQDFVNMKDTIITV